MNPSCSPHKTPMDAPKEPAPTAPAPEPLEEVPSVHVVTLAQVVESLKALEALTIESKYPDIIFFDDYAADTMLADIQCMAEDYLITDSGHCNWDNITALKDAGYDVTPGEQDCSGWLTGCIHTAKGIIVYG